MQNSSTGGGGIQLPFQSASEDRQRLNAQKMLPEFVNQSVLVIRFLEPVRRNMVDQFKRVHLSPAMLERGEGGFYKPELFQPSRVGRQICPRCKQDMQRVNENCTRCMTETCKNYLVTHVNGPVRGVVDVRTKVLFQHGGKKQMVDFLCGIEKKTLKGIGTISVEFVNACIVVLDRRYDRTVMAGVWRTCGQLADQMGWKIK